MQKNKIYETFSFSGKSENCYGLEIVKINLERHGFKILPFDRTSKNSVLVSLYWPEQILDFIRWRYQSCMRGRTIIVGGNYPTTSPASVFPFAGYIFLGDGELWDGTLDSPYLITKEIDTPQERATTKNILPFLYEDLQTTRRAFVEISRGCKNKCAFCQYGWLKPYRECNIVDIAEIINRVKTKSVRCFAADRFQHSHYLQIRKLLEKRGKCDTGSDVSIKFILKHSEYLEFTNKVRIGIEGLSYRLRKMVGKPFTENDLFSFCGQVASAGIKCLDFYMIYGLPTEGPDDVEEFKCFLLGLEKVMPAGYNIAIHWNAFTPSAQTPFQWEAPAGDKYSALYDMLYNGHRSLTLTIYHKPKMTSIRTIIRRVLAIRSDEKTAKLVFNYAYNKSKFEKVPEFILREYKKATGLALLGEWPVDIDMPWDRYCIYQRDKMLKRRIRAKSAKIEKTA